MAGKRAPSSLLGCLLAMAFGGFSAASAYVISGTVVDSRSHAALANVRVTLAPTTARERKLEQVTETSGRFSFAVPGPGKYLLQIAKPGYPIQAYKQPSYSGAASAIAVRDDQDTRNIIFEAYRGAVIAGRITDEDSDPVANALVAVLQAAVVSGERRVVLRGQVRTNAKGEFRVPNLPRGNYYVCAIGRPWFADSVLSLERIAARKNAVGLPGPGSPPEPVRVSLDPSLRGTAFPAIIYPQAQSVEEASPIHLDSGAEAQVSFTLPLVPAVSIKGVINVPAGTGQGLVFLNKRVGDASIPFAQAAVLPDGTVRFENVPAGSYELAGTSQSNSGASSWFVQQPIEVGAADLEPTLNPSQLNSFSGRVVFEGETPPAADLFVSIRREDGLLLRDAIGPQMTFSFTRVPPGLYELTAGNTDYLAVYAADPAGRRLPLRFEIKSGDHLQRDLTLTRAVSTIEGAVETAGVPQAGVAVLLLPKDASYQAYRADQTDSDGSYQLSTVPSGDYFLIALPDANEVAYRDPKIMAALSKAARLVHVGPGERLQQKLEITNPASIGLP
jgi:hypothetical protein